MKCKRCGKEFNLEDSLSYELCQDCWEKYCDEEWWKAVESVELAWELLNLKEKQCYLRRDSMRDIKFRGKSIDNGEWVYGDLLIQKNSRQCLIRPYDTELQEYIFYEVSPETVGQYIEFKDRNEKEIYEGDIIKTNDGMVCEVVYEEEWCRFVCVYKNGAVGHMPFIIEEDGIVIGNVFENPELLRE